MHILLNVQLHNGVRDMDLNFKLKRTLCNDKLKKECQCHVIKRYNVTEMKLSVQERFVTVMNQNIPICNDKLTTKIYVKHNIRMI